MWTKLLAAAKKGKKALDTAKKVKGAGDEASEVGKKIAIGSAIGCGGSLLFTIIGVAIIAMVILSPLFYINDLLGNLGKGYSNFAESLGNFLTFRGWCTDQECAKREKNDFYEYVEKLSRKYGIKLDTNLLVATLTYSDPSDIFENDLPKDDTFDDDTDFIGAASSELVNYRKSKKKAKGLAQELVKKYDEYIKDKENGADVDIRDDYYYRGTLEKFVLQFYFNGREESKAEAARIVTEIFQRVDLFAEIIKDDGGYSSSLSNINVVVMTCDEAIPLATYSLYDYIRGLMYIEAAAPIYSDNVEYLKAMAIVVKNYLFRRNNVSPNNIPTELRIGSCEMKQIFCSVDEGCHDTSNGSVVSNGIEYKTFAPGPEITEVDGELVERYYREPITDPSTLNLIDEIVKETLNLFIVDENNRFVATEYRSSCANEEYCSKINNRMDQSKARQMDAEGKTFREIIDHFYQGTIVEITLSIGGYPLDPEYTTLTSQYGWRKHPIRGTCSLHSGADFGVGCGNNIYAIADGVVTLNLSEAESGGYGNYIVIGHGKEENDRYEFYTSYAHMQEKSILSEGDVVRAGEQIGFVGTTGTSTGCHLHLEYFTYENGRKTTYNPIRQLGYDVQYSGSNYFDTKEECCRANPGAC